MTTKIDDYLDRVRKYEEEKRNLPKNLSPKEYEQAVRQLAEKWRI